MSASGAPKGAYQISGATPFHIVRLRRQEQKPDQISECIDQRHDLGRQASAQAPDGLGLNPAFAPVAFW